MTAIRSRGRRGSTIVPNWRWEDPDLDPYDLRVAGWLASHADGWVEKYVTRNRIASKIGMSGERVSTSLRNLEAAGIIEIEEVAGNGGRRFQVVFDFDAWEAERWSPDDQGVVATRPLGGRQTTTSVLQEEEQGLDIRADDASEAAVDDAEFELFWATYGRVGPKKVARRCWDKARKQATAEEILEGLFAWVEYWQKPGAASVKWPQGWLNEERWNVEPPPIRGAAASQSRSEQNQSILRRMRESS